MTLKCMVLGYNEVNILKVIFLFVRLTGMSAWGLHLFLIGMRNVIIFTATEEKHQ